MTDKDKLKAIQDICNESLVAQEYFDNFIANDWVKLPFLAKKLIDQQAQTILDIIHEKDR